MKKLLAFNAASTFISSALLAALGLVSMPILFRYFGAEKYALIGSYFLVMQWSAFLDLGVAPAFSRFCSRFSQQKNGLGRVNFFYHKLEVIALPLAGVSLLATLYLARAFSTVDILHVNIALLGLLLFSRVMVNFQRSGLMAMEVQVRSAVVSIVANTCRFLIPLLCISAEVLTLFIFLAIQLIVNLAEAFVLRCYLARSLGGCLSVVESPEVWRHLRFGISVSGLSFVWLCHVQVDKLLISERLSSDMFGLYLLVVQLSSVVLLVGAAVQSAVLPRLTRLNEEGRAKEFTTVYLAACMVVGAVGVLGGGGLFLWGGKVLSLLTGLPHIEPDLVYAAIVYALANGAVNIMGINYALQNAKGYLRFQWWGTLTFLFVQLFSMAHVARYGSVVDMALLFFFLNVMYLVFFGLLIHRKVGVPNSSWLLSSVLPFFLVSVLLLGSTF